MSEATKLNAVVTAEFNFYDMASNFIDDSELEYYIEKFFENNYIEGENYKEKAVYEILKNKIDKEFYRTLIQIIQERFLDVTTVEEVMREVGN